MSTSSSPTRLGKDVHAAARAAAALTGRTVAEQLTHWARVGSEVEALSLIELRRRRVAAQEILAGRDYDSVAADEQALVRTAWDDEMEARIRDSDLATEKQGAGLPVITLDEHGNVIRHLPDGTVEPL